MEKKVFKGKNVLLQSLDAGPLRTFVCMLDADHICTGLGKPGSYSL